MSNQSKKKFANDERNDRQCVYCRADLPFDAVRCSSCGAFQNWRRHLNLSGVVLSLLVALLSVSALTVPIFVETFRGKRSILSFDLSFNTNEYAYFHFRNKGGAPGLIQSIEFVVGDYSAAFDLDQLGENTDERLIRSNVEGVVRIRPTRLTANGLLIEMHSDEVEALLPDLFQWHNSITDKNYFKNFNIKKEVSHYDILPGGLAAKATDQNTYDDLEYFHKKVRVGLSRAQYLFNYLTIEDVQKLDYEGWYQPNSSEDILRILKEHWTNMYEYADVEKVECYLETIKILKFLDEVFEKSRPHFLIRLRDSDGKEVKVIIPVKYQGWRRFLRPIILGTQTASRQWIAFF
jgi:hypothetical protein